jgi:cell division transport system permease protein
MGNMNYYIGEVWFLLKRQKIGNVVMLLSMALLMALLTFTIAGALLTSYITDAIRDEAEIDVYLSQDVSTAVANRIERMFKEAETRIVSAEEAYARMEALLGSEQTVLSLFEENPFEGYIEVKLPIEYAADAAEKIEKITGVDYVRDNQAVLESIDSLSKLLQQLSALLLAGVTLGSFLILSGLIRQSIHQYQSHIQVMQLLGAPRAFIQIPFYIEGLLLSMLSMLAALLFGIGVIAGLFAKLQMTVIWFPLPESTALFGQTALVMSVFSLFIGIAGSFFGLRTAMKN